ncbi:MAG: hypothetical protein OEY64_07540 [Nitrospinota bacterium]|nr:hypothetical protein [Nitrospinota bacterium]
MLKAGSPPEFTTHFMRGGNDAEERGRNEKGSRNVYSDGEEVEQDGDEGDGI